MAEKAGVSNGDTSITRKGSLRHTCVGVAIGRKADEGQIGKTGANDPKRSSIDGFCCGAQRLGKHKLYRRARVLARRGIDIFLSVALLLCGEETGTNFCEGRISD